MTTLQSDELLGAQHPKHQSVPSAPTSAGLEAVELAASAGLTLDPWQAHVLAGALGERADGKWAASEVGLIVARQNGKGSILEARELAGLFLFGERLILHSAHEFKTAAEAFRRVLSLVQSTPDLDRRVMRVRTSHGEEGIELKGGQRLRFVARSTGSGRGFSGDTIILDEAYNLTPEALAALFPTMAAMPNPQLWYTSSAPLAHSVSDVLRKLCKRGRSCTSARLAYFEWCADRDAGLDARTAWADANPGLGIRISEEFIVQEREALGDVGFARERLGIWEDDNDKVPALPNWFELEDPRSGIAPTGRVALALDVAPNSAAASFGAAGLSARVGGGVHLELVDHRLGTDWVVKAAAELHAHQKVPIAIATNSPAWALEPALRKAGVEILPVSAAEHAQACGAIFNLFTDRGAHHMGQQALDDAALDAAQRDYGDGAWLWSRKNSLAEISPLVAVTLAAWALTQPETAPATVPLGAWR